MRPSPVPSRRSSQRRTAGQRSASETSARTIRVVLRRGAPRRELLRDVLAAELGKSPAEVVLETDTRGKPWVASPPSDLRFSVSHTEGATLVATAREVDVGVDVERERDVTSWRIWEHALTQDEIATLPDERVARNAALLQAWVAKEAILKAEGSGLAVDPRGIELSANGQVLALPAAFGVPADWSLTRLDINGFFAAVACRPPVSSVAFEEALAL